MLTETIEKFAITKGSDIAKVSMKRVSKGLQVTVEAHPALEEMFSSMSGGQMVSANNNGRSWVHPDSTLEKPVSLPPCYTTSNAVGLSGCLPLESGQGYYRVDTVGLPLLDMDGYIHIGFLRFQGVSQPGGITFVVKGVFSPAMIKSTAEKINLAIKRLFIDFMKPVDILVVVSTQELLS